jgi:hypothetical protein
VGQVAIYRPERDHTGLALFCRNLCSLKEQIEFGTLDWAKEKTFVKIRLMLCCEKIQNTTTDVEKRKNL